MVTRKRKPLTPEQKIAKAARDKRYRENNKERINERRRQQRAAKKSQGQLRYGDVYRESLDRLFQITRHNYEDEGHKPFRDRFWKDDLTPEARFWGLVQDELDSGGTYASIERQLKQQIEDIRSYVASEPEERRRQSRTRYLMRGDHGTPQSQAFYWYHGGIFGA